jgi:hypothetical protein
MNKGMRKKKGGNKQERKGVSLEEWIFFIGSRYCRTDEN